MLFWIKTISRPVNKSIKEAITIQSSNNEVWKILSAPSHLELFHPFCKRNSPLTWNNSENKLDEIEYLNGLIYKRVFRAWEKNSFSLTIVQREKSIAHVEWILSEASSSTKVEIIVYPFNSNQPKILYPALFFFYIRPKLKHYLKSVLGGLKYYAENKKETPRNILGKHSWYS